MKSLGKKIWPYLKTKYSIVAIVFFVWIFFFDNYNFFFHLKLKEQKNELIRKSNYYDQEISKNKKLQQDLQDPEKLEKFAREKFLLKKDDEDVFIISTEK